MERYCRDEFKNLKFGDTDINQEEFISKINAYIDQCKKEAYSTENENLGQDIFARYDIDEMDRSALLYHSVQGHDILLLDNTISVEDIKKMILPQSMVSDAEEEWSYVKI